MTDFQVWLLRNNDHLVTYSLEEIGELAIACGFSRLEVAQWLMGEKFRRTA